MILCESVPGFAALRSSRILAGVATDISRRTGSKPTTVSGTP